MHIINFKIRLSVLEKFWVQGTTKMFFKLVSCTRNTTTYCLVAGNEILSCMSIISDDIMLLK